MATTGVLNRPAAAAAGVGASGTTRPAVATASPTVDIVIPVYNEEADLERSVRRLHDFIAAELPVTSTITIVDNASTDRTWAIAVRLRDQLDGVDAIRLGQKGRGRALRTAWTRSRSPIVAYMDVDLSTDLRGLLPLVAPLLSGHSEVAIGSRLLPGSRVRRGLKRELISRAYNRLLRTALRVRFGDAQCGFKALRTDVARRLLPAVEDQAWFFDTELLVAAERAGMRIHEVAVDWTDDPDSRVDIVPTALADLRGVLRLLRQKVSGALDRRLARLARFAGIGALSTAAYALLYAALRGHLTATAANTVALLVTAVANTEANRRITFAMPAGSRLVRDHAGGLLAFAGALAITTAAVRTLGVLDPRASPGVEVAVLVVANAVATLVRFVLLAGLVAVSRAGDEGRTPSSPGR